MCIHFFEKFPKLISDEKHAKLLFWIMFGHIPDLSNPLTMNEYIYANKISDEKLDYWRFTDKYEVRKSVQRHTLT
jgi:hypothetical protein